MAKDSKPLKESISTFFNLPDIAQVTDLQPLEKDILCYLTEQTLRRQDHMYHGPAIVLGTEFGRRVFGSEFSKAVRQLLNLRAIFNVPYELPNGSLYFSPDYGLARQFRLCSEAITALREGKYVRIPTKVSFRLPRVSRQKPVLLAQRNPRISSNHLFAKIADNYGVITLRREWRNWFDQSSSAGCLRHSLTIFTDIRTKRLHITEGEKSPRVYHPVLNLKRELRQFVRIEGERMAELDGVEFHPHLLATFLDGFRQREYLDFVQRGLYQQFVTEKTTRDMVKRAFQVFLSGYKTFDGSAADKIRWWFEQNFPEITERIAKESGIQATLQTIEAKLFVHDIFASCPTWALPMHDGIACKESDAESLKEFVSERIVDHLGFPIPLTTKVCSPSAPSPVEQIVSFSPSVSSLQMAA